MPVNNISRVQFLHERQQFVLKELPLTLCLSGIPYVALMAIMYQYVRLDHIVIWLAVSVTFSFISYWLLNESFDDPERQSKALLRWQKKIWFIALFWSVLWMFIPLMLMLSQAPIFIFYTVLIVFILTSVIPTTAIGLFDKQYMLFIGLFFMAFAYSVYSSSIFIDPWIVILGLCVWVVLTLYIYISGFYHKKNLYTQMQYKAAQKIAEDSMQKQQQLMATVSHDVRQPFQALTLFLSAIDRDELSDDNQNLIQQLQSSTDALNGLLNHLLDLSLLESGNINIETSVFDIQSVIQPLVAQFDIQARKKGLSLHCDHESYWVKTDVVLLKRILSNLLDNAITYTKKGSIAIRLIERDFQLSVSVIDTGIGMSEYQRSGIFDLYYQVEKDISVRSKHVGLGLSIVKELSDLLRLTLSVESQENQGSKFTLTLDQVDTIGRSLAIVKSDSLWDLSDVTMLVIDPEENHELAFLLASWRANVMLAQSMDEARQILRKSLLKPVVVLIDDILLGDVIEDISILYSNSVRPLYIILGDKSNTSAYYEAEQLPKPLKPMQLRTLIQRKLNE